MTSRGVALPVALWAVVVLSALATSAFVTALLDLRLAVRHQEHAAALHIAEAGVAMATATLAADPLRRVASDSISGSIDGADFSARWVPRGEVVVVTARGAVGSAVRVVEAWLSFDASGASRISAWREVHL